MRSDRSQSATAAWNKDDLFGSWRVVSAKGYQVDADGTKTENETALDGVIIFTPQHRMIAFVTHLGRKPAKDDAETLALFRTMVAYTGRFTLEPGKYQVKLDFTSSQMNLDEPQVRLYRIEGDTLTIDVPEHNSLFDPGKRNSNQLIAIREK